MCFCRLRSDSRSSDCERKQLEAHGPANHIIFLAVTKKKETSTQLVILLFLCTSKPLPNYNQRRDAKGSECQIGFQYQCVISLSQTGDTVDVTAASQLAEHIGSSLGQKHTFKRNRDTTYNHLLFLLCLFLIHLFCSFVCNDFGSSFFFSLLSIVQLSSFLFLSVFCFVCRPCCAHMCTFSGFLPFIFCCAMYSGLLWPILSFHCGLKRHRRLCRAISIATHPFRGGRTGLSLLRIKKLNSRSRY